MVETTIPWENDPISPIVGAILSPVQPVLQLDQRKIVSQMLSFEGQIMQSDGGDID